MNFNRMAQVLPVFFFGLILLFIIGGCSPAEKTQDPPPKSKMDRTENQDFRMKRPGFKSEYSQRSRAAFIKLRAYRDREEKGETLTEDERLEYKALQDRMEEMRARRGAGQQPWRKKPGEKDPSPEKRPTRPSKEEMQSLREIHPPFQPGPDRYREKVEEVRREFGEEAAEGLRNILRSFLTEAIKIRDTFPDEPEKRREKIKKLKEDIDRQSDEYIEVLKRKKK
ncbi:MAG: hypothetical protein MUP70_13505 [Candidatus Aminicenantes bacterium]|nr:hypothetical protein [Candidatus Aminicenantes bacterium]